MKRPRLSIAPRLDGWRRWLLRCERWRTWTATKVRLHYRVGPLLLTFDELDSDGER